MKTKRFTATTWKRTYRTFLQAFLGTLGTEGVLIAAGFDWTQDKKTIITAILTAVIAPAISAGCAAVMNLEQQEAGEVE